MDNQPEETPVGQDWTRHINTKTILKVLGGVFAVYIVLWGLVAMLNQPAGLNQGSVSAPSIQTYDSVDVRKVGVYGEMARAPVDDYGGSGSYDEAAYETQEYNAQFKTQEYEATCDTIESWKPEPSVIFEHASRGDAHCSYRFKVERDRAALIISELEKLDPRDLSEQTRVVKRQLTEYTSELQILRDQEALLEQTLEDVAAAYDELVQYSKDAKDAESLAKGIEGKLQYIERLSRERAQIAAQLDSLSRRTAELTDRIEYVYFNVSVVLYEVINGERIKDSWMVKMQQFVWGVNAALQTVTVGLLTSLLYFAVFALYFTIFLTIIIFVAKNGWRAAKRYWEK